MVLEWLVIGFVVAIPISLYVAAIALLNRLLRKQKPKIFAVQLSSKQATQCQVSKSNGLSKAEEVKAK